MLLLLLWLPCRPLPGVQCAALEWRWMRVAAYQSRSGILWQLAVAEALAGWVEKRCVQGLVRLGCGAGAVGPHPSLPPEGEGAKPGVRGVGSVPGLLAAGCWLLGVQVFGFSPSPVWMRRGAQRPADKGLRLSEPKASLSKTPLGASTAGCPQRSEGTQPVGSPFFGVLFFGETKKSASPAGTTPGLRPAQRARLPQSAQPAQTARPPQRERPPQSTPRPAKKQHPNRIPPHRTLSCGTVLLL